MRGNKVKQVEIGGFFNVEDRIGPKHPIREVKRQCDTALRAVPDIGLVFSRQAG